MKKNEEIVNETTDLAVSSNNEILKLFGEKVNAPAFIMFDLKKVLKPSEVINLASGENLSISEVLNKELILQAMGAVKLDYVDEQTGEFGTYVRYILVTDQGNFTTSSTFVGRTLKMLYQITTSSPKIMFKQKEKEGKRRFIMEML